MNKNLKRILSLVLAVSMLLSMAVFSVSADDTVTDTTNTTTISPTMIGYVNSAGGGDVTSRATINQKWANGNGYGNLYYIFNEIEDWSALEDAVFTVYRSVESTKTLNAYAVGESFDITSFASASASAKKSMLTSYVGKGTKTTMTSVDTYDPDSKMLSLKLLTVNGMEDGYSLVLYFYNTSSTSETMGGNGNETEAYRPVITATKDTEAFNASIISAVNSATDAATLVTALDTYKNTIGIADIYNANTAPLAAEAFLSEKTADFTSFEEIVTAYTAAESEVSNVLLGAVNSAATAQELEDVFSVYSEIIGLSDNYASAVEKGFNLNNAETIITNKPADGYADLAAVATAYDAAYEENLPVYILGLVNSATAETIATVLETYATEIGIDYAKYAVATEEINAALIVEADFASLEAVAEAYNNAYLTGILNKVNSATAETLATVLETYAAEIGIDYARYAYATEEINAALVGQSFTALEAVAEAYNNAYYTVMTVETVGIDKVYVDTWHDVTRQFSDHTNVGYATAYKKLHYYVFNNIEKASAMVDVKFKVQGGNFDKNITFYVSKTPFPVLATGVDSYTADKALVDAFTSASSNADLQSASVAITYADSKITAEMPDSLTLSDGDSILVYAPNSGSINMYGGASNPVLSYDINVAEYEASVLEKVNNAETEEALSDILELYADVIGINASGIVYANSTVFAGRPYADLEAVKAAFNAVIDARYSETMTGADRVINYHMDNLVYTDVTAEDTISRYRRYSYYIFDDVVGFNEARNAVFSTYASVIGNSDDNNAIKVYTLPAGLNVDDYAVYETDDEENQVVSNYNFADYLANATSTTDIAIHTAYESNIQSWELPDLDIADGETVVIRIKNAQETSVGSMGYVKYIPRISYEVDTEIFNTRVLNAVNSTTTEAEVESVLTTYASVIGIDEAKITLLKDNGALAYFVGGNLNTAADFTDLNEVKSLFVGIVEELVTWEEHSIEISSDVRQSFDGFGYTAKTSTWSSLDSEAKDTLLTNGIDKLNMGTLKLWVNLGTNVAINNDGSVDVTGILNRYKIGTGEGDYDYAVAHGVKSFILGPSQSIPESMRVEGGTSIAEDKADEYGVFLADVIKALRDEGVNITMTTIINESQCGFTRAIDGDNAYIMAAVVEALRARLDELLLTDVKIALPEIANVDSGNTGFFSDFQTYHAETLEKVDAYAVHSYNMSLTNSFGNTLWEAGIPVISTESCDTKKGAADDYARAATNAARFLNDVNNGTTLWTQYHTMGSYNDATSLVWYNSTTKEVVNTASHEYMELMARGFVPGTTIRKAKVDGSSVNYTYGSRKPKINVAAGVNSDNEWVIAVVNGTDDGKSYLDYGFRTYADTYITATITIDELASVAEKKFILYANRNGVVTKTEVTAVNGVITIEKLYPREIIMLKEVSEDTSKVIYSNVKDGKAYVRINADAAMDGVVAEYGANALKDVSFYNLTEGINAVSEDLTDATENVGVMTFDGIGTLKPNMDKVDYSLNN